MEDRQQPNDNLSKVTRDYWKSYAEAFALPLHGNGLLGTFISNPDVTGAYAEAWVHSLVKTMVPNLRISTGAVIRTTDVVMQKELRAVPQCDLIIWDPREMPGLFQSGNFALVHTQAARAIIEIKRTITQPESLKEQLTKQKMRLFSEYRRNILTVVVAHEEPLFSGHVEPDWVANTRLEDDVMITRLIDKRTSKPDPDGIFALIYFLNHVAKHPKVKREKSVSSKNL